jgi:hypothetical protein
MSIILAAQEAEIKRIIVQSQPRQTVHETVISKKKPLQKRDGRMAQGVGPEIKSQY